MRAARMRKLVRWIKKPVNRAIIRLSILQGITCGAVTYALIALRNL